MRWLNWRWSPNSTNCVDYYARDECRDEQHIKKLEKPTEHRQREECVSVVSTSEVFRGLRTHRTVLRQVRYWDKHCIYLFGNHSQIPPSLLAEPISKIGQRCQMMLAFLATLAAGARTCDSVLVSETGREIYWADFFIKVDD